MSASDPDLRHTFIVYPQGGLTQGVLFTCAVAENYTDCRVFGLIITARCDADHDKVRCYNYVPVVMLDDWVHRDGRVVLAERLLADTIGLLRAALRDGGFSTAVLETEEPRTILDKLFVAGQAKPKARNRFAELCDRYDLAVSGLLSAPSDRISLAMANDAPGMRDNLLAELVHQKLAGYYFLDRVAPDYPDTGYVALLREVQALPRHLARAVAEGLDMQHFRGMCSTHPELRDRLSITADDLAMPIGLMSSPNLEHFVQSFALLFSRIGIADPDPSYLAALWTRQPSVIGA